MEVEKAIRDVLLAAPGVSQMVADRIYPGQAPQNATMPRIEFGVVATEPDIHHGGRGNCDRRVVNIHSVAAGYEQAKALAAAVDRALSPASASEPSPHPSIGVCLLDDEYDQVDPPSGAGDDRARTIVQNFIVWAA